MKILFLAPQPFYQERGTPIAVRMALQVLAKNGNQMDLITYHEGHDITIPGVSIYRIKPPAWLRGVGPGISIKKLICDFYFFLKVLELVKKESYDLVHAVEESVFFAWWIRKTKGTPYVYDMDSSLTRQLCEQWKIFIVLRPLFKLLEGKVVRDSLHVVAVCEALVRTAKYYGAKSISILQDVSLLHEKASEPEKTLRQQLIINKDRIILYVGNLEGYQGIALLIDSFKTILDKVHDVHLVIIGGSLKDIGRYRLYAGEAKRIHFMGPRPLEHLGAYISEADILVSPRVRGNNTPMKIYSYLHAGKPLVATNIESHTQVLDDNIAVLTAADPKAYGKGMLDLLTNQEFSNKIAIQAKERAEERHTYKAFEKTLIAIYQEIGTEIGAQATLKAFQSL